MFKNNHPLRYVSQLKGDLTRINKELKDNLENHQALIIKQTSLTLKAPTLPYNLYNENLEVLAGIKKELSQIKREISRANTKIYFIKKELEDLGVKVD